VSPLCCPLGTKESSWERRCETDSAGVPASSEGNVIVIDTQGVGMGDGGWNDRVLNGLFKMLASPEAHTNYIKNSDLGHIQN